MAHIQKYYISEVLRDICGRLGDITGAVFADHRPVAKNEQMGEMMVVSLPNSLDDQNAWQKTFLRIEMIVRDRPNGHANIPRLDTMLNAVASKFPMVTPRYSATRPKLIVKGDDGLGFTIWTIQAKLLINTTDSYK